MIKYLAFILIGCLFTIEDCYAQDNFYFSNYQVEDGLSHNTVMCSLQDDKGFIWLGTKDGLNRFDGNAFKIFRHSEENKNSIGNDYVRCLSIDKTGRMLVGTQSGLYQYHPKTESFTHIASSGNKSIKEICVDMEGNIWYIAEGTLICQRQNKVDVYPNDKYFSPTAFCLTENGTLWTASSDGNIRKFNAATNSFTTFPILSQQSTGSWIETMYGSNDSSILIGTSAEGLYSFSTNTGSVKSLIRYNQDKTGIYVRDILQINADEFWLATESGIFVYNDQKNSIINLRKDYHNPYSLSDNAVYTLCKDQEGGLWAGTYFGGVNYFAQDQLLFQKYFPDYSKTSISGNAVREIVKDKYGSLWIGTEDAGLNKLDKDGKITHFMPTGNSTSLSYYNIHGLLAADDKIWVGTFEHGLDVLDIKSGKVIRHYGAGSKPGDLRSNFIFSLYKTVSGLILVGTTAGVFEYNKQQDIFIPVPALNGYTYNILEDHAGVWWSATIAEGIKYYNPRTTESGSFTFNPAVNNSLSNNMVNSLYEDDQHNLWIATEGGGVCRLSADRKTIKRYNTRNGLPSNFIFKILQDGQRKLWMSTSKGLVQFDPATASVKVYTSVNGLLNDQFNYNSGFKDEQGRMYFGSVKGMISFTPNNLLQNKFNPPVVFTGFQVNNVELPIEENGTLSQSMLYTKSIKLSHKQSSFSIDFAALSHTAPQMTTYAYKMEGLDTGWTYLEKNRKVYFTNLSAGTYTFKVRAANSSGIWNTEAATLKILILPPWWLSKAAYVLYFLLGAMLALLMLRYYHRHLKKENQQRMDLLIFEKEKEIYDAKMKFFTNIAHEIRTPLTLIKGPLERVIDKTAGMPEIKNSLASLERNTNRLLHLTDQLLDYRKTEAGGFVLTFEEENISRLLEESFASFTSLAEQKQLQYLLHLPQKPLVAYADNEVLTKILSNLLSNAIKYANKEVRISLHTDVATKSFSIEIDNDGFLIPDEMKEKVFEPFVRLKGTDKQQGTGIGLALARSLAQLHQGSLMIKKDNKIFNRFILHLPMLQLRPTAKNDMLPEENTNA